MRIVDWVDLSGYGMRLRLLRDRGAAEWCVMPAEGWTPQALDIHAPGLSAMGFSRHASGMFHHPAAFDRDGRPRNQPLAGHFQAGFPLARAIPFDRTAHVVEGRPAVRREPDPEARLEEMMRQAVSFAREHGLNPEEALASVMDERPGPPGP